ncbi:lipopolysaccharide heptosyltransferase II [Candidatus Erwinia haradaeae]|uniref:lipopolysaccharide heptosyltransferase II n=1 Tax=Candidatus Erwinia haradaeae TaxID=1922217 RepID=A0A451DAF8_9GAMM|nr:lipopolysaccharide heptosyltransferase II [Candidatus Erwinia haradaeae]VFP83320.1 ADP-heptose--LPS heptosyltransferase 2 [Candidatus Erwinia haradaeae]
MKILIIGPSWIGDMMMSHSLYRTLKMQNPDSVIDVLAPAWSHPLLLRMPEVNAALLMPLGHGVIKFMERWYLSQKLRIKNYDQAFVLPGSFKSSLIPFLAAIPHRTGWRGEMRYGLLNDIRILKKSAFPLMVQRYVALSCQKSCIHNTSDLPHPLLMPKLQVHEKEKHMTLRTFGLLNQSRPMIGFCPGTALSLSKQWPYYHYAALARTLINKGYRILVFGSVHDKNTGEKILLKIPSEMRQYYHNLTGKTHLEEAVVMLSCCHTVISNDSGLMHITAALDRPLIGLYGLSNPQFTPPLSTKARIICDTNKYPPLRNTRTSIGYHQSLININPDRVMNEIDKLHDTIED